MWATREEAVVYPWPFRKCKEKGRHKDRDLAFASIQRLDRETTRNVKKKRKKTTICIEGY